MAIKRLKPKAAEDNAPETSQERAPEVDTVVDQGGTDVEVGTETANPGVGHNSGAVDNQYGINGIAKDKLVLFASRLDRLDEEKKEIASQVKELKAEAKALGFDVKALMEARRYLAADPEKREEAEAMRDIYLLALETASEEQV